MIVLSLLDTAIVFGVDRTGIEPVTSTMPLWRSPMLS
jgi:hypothetical protein